MDRRDNW